jgi:hypothetical protein
MTSPHTIVVSTSYVHLPINMSDALWMYARRFLLSISMNPSHAQKYVTRIGAHPSRAIVSLALYEIIYYVQKIFELWYIQFRLYVTVEVIVL